MNLLLRHSSLKPALAAICGVLCVTGSDCAGTAGDGNQTPDASMGDRDAGIGTGRDSGNMTNQDAGASASDAGSQAGADAGVDAGSQGNRDAGGGGWNGDGGGFDKLRKLSEGWAPNEWHELPDVLARVLLTRAEADAIDPNIWQVSGSGSAMQIWTSAAFDGRHLYVGAGGGHSAYNGNEFYAYDFESLSWARLYDPSPTKSCGPAGPGLDCIPVWGPTATHHYDDMIYSKKTNSLFMIYINGGADACWVWRMSEPDPKTAWKQFACPTNFGYAYVATAEDPKTGAIVAWGGGITGAASLDPTTLTWSRQSARDSIWGIYQVTDIDPVRRMAFFLGQWTYGPKEMKFNVSGINIDADPLANGFVSNSEPPPDLNGPCFIYHSKSHKMITWNSDNNLWSYDPGADKWTAIPTTGVSPTRSSPNGAYQKCAYLEDVDLFVGTNDENRGVFAIRAALE